MPAAANTAKGYQPLKTPGDIRVVQSFSGCYSLNGHRDEASGRRLVLACRAQSVSTTTLVLEAPLRGDLGEDIIVKLDDLGILYGRVERHTLDGFAVAIDASDNERQRLAARLDWMKQRRFHKIRDHRDTKRRLPRNTRSSLTLLDGRRLDAVIIDMSRSGVALTAELRPGLGVPVAVGRLLGRTVRHLETGFAVQFAMLRDDAALEAELAPLGAEGNDVLVDQLRAYAGLLATGARDP
jgi:hypothetical protein